MKTPVMFISPDGKERGIIELDPANWQELKKSKTWNWQCRALPDGTHQYCAQKKSEKQLQKEEAKVAKELADRIAGKKK